MDQIERRIGCPYCGEPITVLIDPSIVQQDYIEDCQVCCQPINLSVMALDDSVGVVATTDGE